MVGHTSPRDAPASGARGGGGRDAKNELWVRIEGGWGVVKENRWKIVKGAGGGEWGEEEEDGQGIVERERDRMFTVNKDGPTGFVDIYC